MPFLLAAFLVSIIKDNFINCIDIFGRMVTTVDGDGTEYYSKKQLSYAAL